MLIVPLSPGIEGISTVTFNETLADDLLPKLIGPLLMFWLSIAVSVRVTFWLNEERVSKKDRMR